METNPALTPAARTILAALRDAGGELSGYALIKATGHASGTVYPLLERLAGADLLTRRRETEDEWLSSGARRPLRLYYALTDTGREAFNAPDGEPAGPIAIDPYGCNCTECITGEYVPLERASDAQMAALLRGEIRDNTNTGELQVVVTVRRTWGGFDREIDPALLGITLHTDR